METIEPYNVSFDTMRDLDDPWAVYDGNKDEWWTPLHFKEDEAFIFRDHKSAEHVAEAYDGQVKAVAVDIVEYIVETVETTFDESDDSNP